MARHNQSLPSEAAKARAHRVCVCVCVCLKQLSSSSSISHTHRLHIIMLLFSRSVVSNFVTPWTVASRLLCPWGCPGMGCYFLL